MTPHTAYPRFATHALMQTLRSADDVIEAARASAPLAGRIATVVNRCDPAVNNDIARTVTADWSDTKKGAGVEFLEMHDLPEWHDIIDPRSPLAHTEIVYPRLLHALGLAAG